MVGIESYGVYVPLWRLDQKSLGGGQKGERAVANFDEDSLTMGVAAGINCLRDIDRSTIDGLFFATTTSPYNEKQLSVTIAAALDLREDIVTADFAHSLRAGTTAMRTAADTVKAGTAKKILVIAADMRPAMPGSEFEGIFGDGAAAFIIGSDNVLAEIKDNYANAWDIIDTWRADEDRYVRSWEERFAMEEGYLKAMPLAVSALMERNGLTIKDFTKAAFYGPHPRRHRDMARKLSLESTQVQDPMFGSLGDTGAAFSLMILAAALEEAKAGDRLLLASYGNGSDASFIEVLGEFNSRHGIHSYINSKKGPKDYVSYLRWRGILDLPVRGRGRPALVPSASALWREEEKNLRLHGVKCKQCGTVQYPPQRVCIKCGVKDNFDKYRFWDKKAELFTFSPDYGIPSPDPPYVIAVLNFEGGGRIWLTMTDKDVNEIKIGMPLELTLRRLHTIEGIHNYYWKVMPVRI